MFAIQQTVMDMIFTVFYSFISYKKCGILFCTLTYLGEFFIYNFHEIDCYIKKFHREVDLRLSCVCSTV